MSGFILVNPTDSQLTGRRMRLRYAKRVLSISDQEPIRVFLKYSKKSWDLLQNRDGWVPDFSLYRRTPNEIANIRYSDVRVRYYCRKGDYVVVIPSPVGNLVLVVEFGSNDKPAKEKKHSIAIAVPECLIPYLGHQFEDIDEVLSTIHHRPKYDEDDSLYRQVESLIYEAAATKVTWCVLSLLTVFGLYSLGTV